MATDKPIMQDHLQSIINYDPNTGLWHWRWRTDRLIQWNSKYAGKQAGTLNGIGYVQLNIDGQLIHAQRLAFLYMEGFIPKRVDHISGDRSDNRWVNLRAATHAQNLWNCRLRSDSASGHKGVFWDKSRKKWRAEISADGNRVHIGRFDVLEEAVAAWRAKAEELHGEFARFE